MAIKEFPSTPIPSVKGQSGKYLTTNGSNLSWGNLSTSLTLTEIASGSLTSGATLSLTSLGNYDRLRLRVNGLSHGSNASYTATINNSSAGVYDFLIWGPSSNNTTTYDGAEMMRGAFDFNTSSFPITQTWAKISNNTDNYFQLDFENCKSSGFTFFESFGRYVPSQGSSWRQYPRVTGTFKTAAAVTSIEFISSATFNAGNYVLFGG